MTTIYEDFKVHMKALLVPLEVWRKSSEGGYFRVLKGRMLEEEGCEKALGQEEIPAILMLKSIWGRGSGDGPRV